MERNQPRSWARSKEEKAEIFAVHLSKVFKPNSREEVTLEEKNRLLSDDTIPATLNAFTKHFTEMK